MNTIIGDGTIEVGDKRRPYYIGTRQTAIFCEAMGLDLQDYQQLLMEVGLNQYYAQQAREAGQAYEATGRKSLTPTENVQFIYSALAAGAKREGLPIDFTADDVMDWIDAAEPEELGKVFKTHFDLAFQRIEQAKSLQAKNAPAPALTSSRGGKATKAKSAKK